MTTWRSRALGLGLAAAIALLAVNSTASAAPHPGATPRTAAMASAAIATLGREASIPGTAWATDPTTNQVLLTVDRTVTGARLARVQHVVARLGGTVRLEHVAGTFSTDLMGGDAIYGSSYRCSLGFNVIDSWGAFYFLTAGHCGNLASTWYANGSHTIVAGARVGSSFPGNDFAIIRYKAGIEHRGGVDLYGATQDITRSANAYVGEAVRRSGSTSGVHSGHVTGLNATVHYPQGIVSGLIQTNVCAASGDSGGPLFDGGTALGLTSGGSGNCQTGGTTFFQPVTEVLSLYHVTVY